MNDGRRFFWVFRIQRCRGYRGLPAPCTHTTHGTNTFFFATKQHCGFLFFFAVPFLTHKKLNIWAMFPLRGSAGRPLHLCTSVSGFLWKRRSKSRGLKRWLPATAVFLTVSSWVAAFDTERPRKRFPAPESAFVCARALWPATLQTPLSSTSPNARRKRSAATT